MREFLIESAKKAGVLIARRTFWLAVVGVNACLILGPVKVVSK